MQNTKIQCRLLCFNTMWFPLERCEQIWLKEYLQLPMEWTPSIILCILNEMEITSRKNKLEGLHSQLHYGMNLTTSIHVCVGRWWNKLVTFNCISQLMVLKLCFPWNLWWNNHTYIGSDILFFTNEVLLYIWQWNFSTVCALRTLTLTCLCFFLCYLCSLSNFSFQLFRKYSFIYLGQASYRPE